MMTALNPIRSEAHVPAAKQTKFWNRSHATQRVAEELTRVQAESRYEFTILLVEFAGLSEITDRLGYAPADDVWRRVLGALLEDLNPDDLCCRLGGDEFLLILSGRGQLEAQFVVERLRRRWNPSPTSREAVVELNIGIASSPAYGRTIETLLAAADESSQADRMRNELIHSPNQLRQLPV
jgi:diguanylate cyclase (GGDEF)-like protein